MLNRRRKRSIRSRGAGERLLGWLKSKNVAAMGNTMKDNTEELSSSAPRRPTEALTHRNSTIFYLKKAAKSGKRPLRNDNSGTSPAVNSLGLTELVCVVVCPPHLFSFACVANWKSSKQQQVDRNRQQNAP